ncbi:hypothetical protein C9413_06450 [Rhizobium sp. SEMIA 4085]|uniref:Uncharacterized protein n=1 Tax=Rhizobium gallicum bv. gallicum R602sp TaxID=1041138 RepID=A0A0B4XHR2_9HYPH|nr:MULTISPECIES: hypothetical protein [Rhizobium]AJD46143.1 hypothetical protein RGR602_PC02122 [Rhizobium gallicum bv. gallicum R602sp]NNH29158.1 hypothetical protein [Rhizobium sp. SEMIA 4085]
MPQLIRFIITRIAIGFLIGSVVGSIVWTTRFADSAASLGLVESYVAQGLFIFLFGDTIALGYLSTALMMESE